MVYSISLKINDVENLFICLLATRACSFIKCLFDDLLLRFFKDNSSFHGKIIIIII